MIDALVSLVVRVLGLADRDRKDREARAALEKDAADAQRVALEAQARADRLRERLAKAGHEK